MQAGDSMVIPPLKWAGGKRWFVQSHSYAFPNSFRNYIEPFAGSAAAFFHVKPSTATIGDKNAALIETYSALKTEWQLVRRYLIEHQARHSDSHYYRVRASSPRSVATRAARFIYLNRTCFNGIYRVNRDGLFNVPKGNRTAVLLDSDDFESVSVALQTARLVASDFEPLINGAKENDLIFADPPYTVKHNLNGFVKYNEDLFSWWDQVRLFEALKRAANRGAHIVATNADHASVRTLYRGHFRIRSVRRNSMISANTNHRGGISELLITS
jgi:DNA adenine methylase